MCRQEWILCSERTPEINTPVLVYCFGQVLRAQRKWILISEVWDCGQLELLPDDEVTHWMPLPEMPEKVSVEE